VASGDRQGGTELDTRPGVLAVGGGGGIVGVVSVALFALLCLIWGSTWLVIKIGYGGLGPFNIAALRFVLAGTLMAALVPVLRARWPRGREEWSVVFVVGIFLFAVDYGLIYWAEQWLESGITAVLFAVMPLLTALAAHVYLPAEPLTPRRIGGALVAFLGIAALFGDSLRFDSALLWPMAAIVVAAAFAAVASVFAKRHGAALHPAALNAPAMMIGALLLAGASLAGGDGLALPRDTTGWWAVGYLAVLGSVVTFLIYFHLLKTWKATTMSYIAIITPVIALALGWVLRDERVTVWSLAGGLLVLAGVALALGGNRAAPRSRLARSMS
jgi:drug/metabolite transporter (DMT)-like permease